MISLLISALSLKLCGLAVQISYTWLHELFEIKHCYIIKKRNRCRAILRWKQVLLLMSHMILAKWHQTDHDTNHCNIFWTMSHAFVVCILWYLNSTIITATYICIYVCIYKQLISLHCLVVCSNFSYVRSTYC